MNRLTIGVAFITGIILLSNVLLTGNDQKQKEPNTVAQVNVNRYCGLWYEIAKIPNRFQRKCERSTTAQYSLRNDGKIDVVNQCIDENGKIVEAKGIAKIIDPVSRSKLKVSFVRILGISLFWGDYWIIGLDENYQYAVVGTPDRKYGWILGREPELSPENMDRVFAILQEQGYDPQDFEMTMQTSDEK